MTNPITITLTAQEFEIVQRAIDVHVDISDDTVTEPLFLRPSDQLLDKALLQEIRKDVEERIDELKVSILLQQKLTLLSAINM